jgi:arsenate reductase
MDQPSILFLCTGNCCRSQMAEGLMRKLAGDGLDVLSAGSQPAGYVHPLAIAVMREIDIDISGHESKGLEAFAGREFDYVVTVCDSAKRACPALRGRKATYHWSIPDPVSMTWGEEGAMAKAREVRDDLAKRLTKLLREIGIPSAVPAP